RAIRDMASSKEDPNSAKAWADERQASKPMYASDEAEAASMEELSISVEGIHSDITGISDWMPSTDIDSSSILAASASSDASIGVPACFPPAPALADSGYSLSDAISRLPEVSIGKL